MTAVLIDIQSPRDQQLAALAEANARRIEAAHARVELREGRITLAQLLGDETAGSLRVFEVLLEMPHCGEWSMRQIINHAGIRTNARYALATKRLRELSPAQRQAIVDEAHRALRGCSSVRVVA